MAVEAAVRQPGLLHDPVHADAIEAVLAEQARCRLDDAIAVLQMPFPGSRACDAPDLRRSLDNIDDDRHVINAMTIVI